MDKDDVHPLCTAGVQFQRPQPPRGNAEINRRRRRVRRDRGRGDGCWRRSSPGCRRWRDGGGVGVKDEVGVLVGNSVGVGVDVGVIVVVAVGMVVGVGVLGEKESWLLQAASKLIINRYIIQ